MNIPIIGELIGLGAQWLRGRNEVKQAELEKRLELVRQAGSWDEIQAQNSATSWKDEFWTLVLAIPMVMSFFPVTRDWVFSGFESLEVMPDWYQYLLTVCIAASFGVKNAIGIINARKQK